MESKQQVCTPSDLVEDGTSGILSGWKLDDSKVNHELIAQASLLLSDDLPEGWEEVCDGDTTYYWHTCSGHVQYQRPAGKRHDRPLKLPAGSRNQAKLTSLESSSQRSPSPEMGSLDLRLQPCSDQSLVEPSFQVHSLGWMEVNEDQIKLDQLANLLLESISSLVSRRLDLWEPLHTLGEGADLLVTIEADSLKITTVKTSLVVLVQHVAKMRVWGVGRQDPRDFGFIYKDPLTGKHVCQLLRCHENISARSITKHLEGVANRLLQESKQQQCTVAHSSKVHKSSDLLLFSSKTVGASLEKVINEPKKNFSAKFIGQMEVSRPKGIELVQATIDQLIKGRTPQQLTTVLVEVSPSVIKITDCSSQVVLTESRVSFVTFLAIGVDDRTFGYVLANSRDSFTCFCLLCTPNAASLSRAVEEACQLRYRKVLDCHPEAQKSIQTTKQSSPEWFSIGALVNRFIRKQTDPVKPSMQEGKGGKQSFVVKYYGNQRMEDGCLDQESLDSAAKKLLGVSMLINIMDISEEGVFLTDLKRSLLSSQSFGKSSIIGCSLTSGENALGIFVKVNHGVVCHVFQEFQQPVADILRALRTHLGSGEGSTVA